MTPNTFIAKVATRTFTFTVVDRKAEEVTIDMYNTPYTLVKKEDRWRNHSSNKMEMSPELVTAVITAINAQ